MSQLAFCRGRLRTALFPVVACLGAGALSAGCQERPICRGDTHVSSLVLERLTTSQVDKVDVLLAVDNSRSMAAKQQLLAIAVPDLVQGLVNPPCLDAKGNPVSPGPKGPLDACPKGAARPFEPVLDIHVGVISSSLGGHGSDSCKPSASSQTVNDKGHLVSRVDPTSAQQVPTYQDLGFLAWDPTQRLSPPGEADLTEDSAADKNATALLPDLTSMILGVGQVGCGLESQLESWYRFLVEPSPYATLSLDEDGRIKAEGVDETLLAQRKSFLRPDSLVAVVLLSDENDCSIRETGQYWLAAQLKKSDGSPFNLPIARQECATDPNDPCCFSCAQAGPKNDDGSALCPEDPMCKDANGDVVTMSMQEDPPNLRCWDQKRRYGIDFLYPIDRYAKGLREVKVTDRNGEVVPNPLFSDLDPSDSNFAARDPSMVIFTGIVGVPWQDVARDPKDLKKGFKTAEELSEPDASGVTRWDVILGEPEKNIAPLDPLMIESWKPRSGTNPITGDPVVKSDVPLGNAINGHEQTAYDQLQYACVFPLPEPLPCDQEGNCLEPDDSPVFDPPYDGSPHDYQVRAGAVPGLRFLSLLKNIGDQGVVASICPAQTSDEGALDFGYRPAVAAALTRLQVDLTKQCLPRVLMADESGQVPCMVIEAKVSEPGKVCCPAAEARVSLPEDHGALEAVKADEGVQKAGYDCFCEIPQLEGTDPGQPLWTCQNDASKTPVDAGGESVNGYCYVDQTSTPPIGNPDIVAACPDTEKRTLRFVGKGNPQRDATVFITCGVTETPPTEDCNEIRPY